MLCNPVARYESLTFTPPLVLCITFHTLPDVGMRQPIAVVVPSLSVTSPLPHRYRVEDIMAYKRRSAPGDWRRRPRKEVIRRVYLKVRVTEEERDAMHARAKAAGVTLSAYVLARVLE